MLGKIFRAIIPSLIAGFFFWFLIALTRGINKIGSTAFVWFFMGIVIFEYLFVLVNRGDRILVRAFRYIAYEFWTGLIVVIIYVILSARHTSNSSSVSGIRGFIIIFISVVFGGFGGLVLFLIGNSINDRFAVKQAEIEPKITPKE